MTIEQVAPTHITRGSARRIARFRNTVNVDEVALCAATVYHGCFHMSACKLKRDVKLERQQIGYRILSRAEATSGRRPSFEFPSACHRIWHKPLSAV